MKTKTWKLRVLIDEGSLLASAIRQEAKETGFSFAEIIRNRLMNSYNVEKETNEQDKSSNGR
jgi:hypothetical protein